ncbi:MAG: type II secretion system protein GspN [Desulfobacterales bacterium]|nr:MAG: type II secretion system protein GspN [Desulfobacterales bacterium]
MTMKKKWLLYLLFILILTTFFVYYLFPADQIKNYMVYQMNKTHPDINITIDQIKPAFPPGVWLYDVAVVQVNDALLISKQIKIVPNLLSLFGSKIIFFFKANTSDGMINGKGELTPNTDFRKIHIDATLSNIQISEIGTVKRLTSRNISGILEGHVTYSQDRASGEDVRARLTISDGKIDLLNPVLMLETIAFNMIESDIVIKNRKVQFKQCRLKGDQMDGNIAGSIILKKPLERSVLKLVGTIRPHPTFLESLEKDLPKQLIPKNFFNKNGLPVKLSGTLEKPIFLLK